MPYVDIIEDRHVLWCEACAGTGRNFYSERPWREPVMGGGDCSICEGRGYVFTDPKDVLRT